MSIKRRTLLRGYTKVKNAALKVLKNYFDKDTALEVEQEASSKYEEIMYHIPYIGGAKNTLKTNLIFSAQVLSFIMVLKSRDMDAQNIGKIIYGIGEESVKAFSPILIILARALFFASFRLSRLSKSAERSRQGEFKGDWVFDFYRQNRYDYRIDYYECGIHKFYNELGYGEYVRYICKLDFLICDLIGVKLERSKTLGDGDNVCDFRYYRE